MVIAVLSDTHGRMDTIAWAMEQIAARAVGLMVHCGDIDRAETVRQFPPFTHFVFGNCDLDRREIRSAIAESGATLHEPFGYLEIGAKKLAWTHGDNAKLLRELENADAFDFVFYGHTHEAKEHSVGRTRVINPGALHRARPKGFLFLDVAEGIVETVAMPV